jgi:hypothetical protein
MHLYVPGVVNHLHASAWTLWSISLCPGRVCLCTCVHVSLTRMPKHTHTHSLTHSLTHTHTNVHTHSLAHLLGACTFHEVGSHPHSQLRKTGAISHNSHGSLLASRNTTVSAATGASANVCTSS